MQLAAEPVRALLVRALPPVRALLVGALPPVWALFLSGHSLSEHCSKELQAGMSGVKSRL